MASTATPPPRIVPCARSNSRAHLGEQRARRATSASVAIGGAGGARADRAGEHAHADQERLLLAEDAGAVEHVLVASRPRPSVRVEPLGERSSRSGSRPKKAGSSSASSTCGRRDDGLGEARRRRPCIVASRSSRPGLELQQREELHAGRQPGEEAVEGGEGGVGVRGRRPAPRAAPARTRSAARARVAERIAG